jgi:serine/threonine protein kinase
LAGFSFFATRLRAVVGFCLQGTMAYLSPERIKSHEYRSAAWTCCWIAHSFGGLDSMSAPPGRYPRDSQLTFVLWHRGCCRCALLCSYASDIWSLGISIIYCATGHIPMEVSGTPAPASLVLFRSLRVFF